MDQGDSQEERQELHCEKTFTKLMDEDFTWKESARRRKKAGMWSRNT
jgi:hypothetical protein